MAKAIAEPTGDKKCPVCGKSFFVQWPTLWTYKRGAPYPKYFCSYKCVREFDKNKEEKVVGKPRVISPENEQEAIKCATAGGDPIETLEPYTRNPKAMWWAIKAKVKETDPETYAKLPDLRNTRKLAKEEKPVTAADAMAACQDAADTFFGQCQEMGLLKEDEKADDDLETTAVRDVNLGEFYFDHDHNCIDWRNGLGDEVSLGPSGWKMMVKMLPKILKKLGVEM